MKAAAAGSSSVTTAAVAARFRQYRDDVAMELYPVRSVRAIVSNIVINGVSSDDRKRDQSEGVQGKSPVEGSCTLGNC
jgi:hypothetical protein